MTMSTSSALDATRVKSLTDGFAGKVLLPSHDGYEAARRVQNGLVDRRPAVIAQCKGTADIAAAVRFANAEGLEISVRGGGHNVAGRCVTEGGLMIDLPGMRAIEVDPDASTARAQGGALWSELNEAAAVHGLAVTGGATWSTGVGGYTMGG